MKWGYLILVLIIGGVLAYYTFRRPELRTDTPRGTADSFVDAALGGDTDRVRSLCSAFAADDAARIAREITAASPDPRSFKWQATTARDPNLSALTALFQGRVLTLELREEAGEYRIVHIDLAN